MKDTITTIALSATATAGSAAASAMGDTVMQWVTLGINVAVLVTNCAISIYRKWRDRDRDLQENESDEKGDGK